MIRWGSLEVAETLEELVVPSRTALLMWDCTERIVSGAIAQKQFVSRSTSLIAAARAAAIPIIYSRRNDVSWEELGPGWVRLRLKLMGMNAEELFRRTNSASAIEGKFAGELAPAPGDVILEKCSTNGFLETSLARILRARGIQTIVIAGISIETGVDHTAREAINQGFYAVIARDAVSSHSQPRYQASMAIIEQIHDVYDSEDLIRIWTASKAAAREESK
jgi:nicotinamidase-related amidase